MYFDGPWPEHPISPNHLKSYPRRILYLEVAHRSIPRLFDCLYVFRIASSCLARYEADGRCTGEEWKGWGSARELCAYIALEARAKSPLWIYSANVFWALQLAEAFRWLPEWGFRLDFIYSAGPTFLLTVSRSLERLRCLSASNYFDCSLSTLARRCGEELASVAPEGLTEAQSLERSQVVLRVLRLTLERYMDFNRAHDTGRFASTRSAQALSCYRHRYLDYPVWAHEVEEVIALERAAYMGGRCEAYRLGRLKGGPFDFYDVDSMYPSVMRRYLFPRRLLRYYKQAELSELEALRGSYAFTAEVSLDTPLPMYAKRYLDTLIFPVGRFHTVVSTEGLWRAVDAGHLRALGRVAVYEWAPIFRRFIEEWWPLKKRYRKQGDAMYAQITKGFLNSLYGKFGQRATELTPLERPLKKGPYRLENCDLATGERWVEYQLMGQAFEQREVGNARNTFVAVAAHVAEYARFALWDWRARLGPERVLYLDTDSLVLRAVDGAVIDRKLRGRGLGALDHASRCQELVLHGAKDYQADGVRILKGVPLEAAEGPVGCYEYRQVSGLASTLEAGLDGALRVRTARCRPRRRYTKGKVRRDGQVEPLELEEF